MTILAKVLGGTLALTLLGSPLVGGGTALAATASQATPSAQNSSHGRVDGAALDALRQTLDRMVDAGRMTAAQKDAVGDAVHRADWDGFSIERLGDILGGLVRRGVISGAQRDAIMDGMRAK